MYACLLTFTLAPSKTQIHIPQTLFDIISLGVDVVKRHDQASGIDKVVMWAVEYILVN